MTQNNEYLFLKKNLNSQNWNEQYKQEFDKQTQKRMNALKKKQDNEDLIVNLNEEINKQSQELRRLTYEEGASISKIKKELYKDDKSKDNNLVLKLITILQVIVLITLLLGMFNIMNKLVLTIVVVFIYIIVIIVIFIRINKDKGRDKFNYNEYNIKMSKNNVCNFKPSSEK